MLSVCRVAQKYVQSRAQKSWTFAKSVRTHFFHEILNSQRLPSPFFGAFLWSIWLWHSCFHFCVVLKCICWLDALVLCINWAPELTGPVEKCKDPIMPKNHRKFEFYSIIDFEGKKNNNMKVALTTIINHCFCTALYIFIR